MKTILITGCSSGLGLALAVAAARSGHQVVATLRDTARRGALDAALAEAGATADVREMDVTDPTSVEKCVEAALAEHGGIDVLVNNAGATLLCTTEQSDEADMAWITDVNYHGVVRTTRAVLPSMRAARRGHIVNITSVGGLVGQPFNEFYCAAKFAVEGYTESLASYVGPAFGIRFSLVEPGGIRTAFGTNVQARMAERGGMPDGPYAPLLESYLGGMQRRSATQDGSAGAVPYQSAEAVADVVIEVIQSDNPPLRTRTSEWSEDFTKLKTMADPTGQKQVDDVIERFLGEYDFPESDLPVRNS